MDKQDRILEELSGFRGEFNEYKSNMERRIDNVENSNGAILEQVNGIKLTCATREGEIANNRKDIDEHKEDHKDGATSREKLAIVGSYILQILLKLKVLPAGG